ncbi:hypothetical protein RB653_010302 [Dictyostelium firmibasis]|uniref:Major facilitator superfamily (MFS) profile domain-containing protein n=1 Tax=Dictyostelium firmibasis TaxID=79012 RepID=A0AAN7YTJ8_9MYCE
MGGGALIDSTPINDEKPSDLNNDESINTTINPNLTSNKKYLVQYIILYAYLACIFISTFLYDIFIPTLLLNYVENKYPDLTPQEKSSKSSYYKSYSDGFPFLVMFLFGPLVGYISDRYGRKSNFYLSVLTVMFVIMSCFVSMETNNIYCFYVFHTIGGLYNVSSSVVFSFIYDITDEKHISLLYTLCGVSMGLGTTIGSLIYAFVPTNKVPYMMLYISSGFALVSLLLVPFLIETIHISRENNRNKTFAKKKYDNPNPFATIKTLFTNNSFISWTILLFFSIQYTGQDIWSTFYYYSYLTYNWDQKTIGLFTLGVGGSTILYSIIIVPLLLKIFSEKKVITIGFFISFCAHIMLSTSKYSQYLFIFGAILSSIVPCVSNLLCSVISKSTPQEVQGSILTGLQSVKAVGSFVGAMVANNLLSRFSSDDAPFYFPQAIYFLNGVVLLVTMFISILIWRFYNNRNY